MSTAVSPEKGQPSLPPPLLRAIVETRFGPVRITNVMRWDADGLNFSQKAREAIEMLRKLDSFVLSKLHAERINDLRAVFQQTLCGKEQFAQLLEEESFRQAVCHFWEEWNCRYTTLKEWSSDLDKWELLFADPNFRLMVTNFWEDRGGERLNEQRKHILEAAEILRYRDYLYFIGQTNLDKRSAPLPKPEPQPERPSWPEGVLRFLQHRFRPKQQPEPTQTTDPPTLDEFSEAEKQEAEIADLETRQAAMLLLMRLQLQSNFERVGLKWLEEEQEIHRQESPEERLRREICEADEEWHQMWGTPFGRPQIPIRSRYNWQAKDRWEKNMQEFDKAHMEEMDKLTEMDCSKRAKEAILTALEFRLALFPYCPEFHQEVFLPGHKENFDETLLRNNAWRSAEELLRQALAHEGGIEDYVKTQKPADTQALWKAQMEILLPSLKLAQKGARFPWFQEERSQEGLDLGLCRLNDALGELSITVRRTGLHLKGQLATQRKLTRQVLQELYVSDPAYAKKVMDDFRKYTVEPNGFLISVDVNPLYSVGEILIAKIGDNPPTYTVEFLYVDRAYRENYALGTLVENIAKSLVEQIPKVRLVATVYSANENMPRHFKRGWVATGLINTGKTLGLQIYEGEFKEERVERAKNHEAFKTLCERYLNQGDYLLTSIEPDSESIDLFPCRVHFKKALTPPKEGFYKHDSH